MSERRPKVLIARKIDEFASQLLSEKCEVVICEGLPKPSLEEILNKCAECVGIFWPRHIFLNGEILDKLGSQLKVISYTTTGLDHVDVAEVKRRGIQLGYTPNIMNVAVADFAVGLMISAARRIHEGYLKIVNNQWDQGDTKWMIGKDINGSTVGIVGLGGIGQQIVNRLKGFNIGTFLYTGHREKEEGKKLGASFVTFDELLNRSDFVFVACPLNSETTHLFDKTAFGKMKSSAVFINVARGDIVVQDDLVEALKNGVIFSAGLDVMTPEPLPFDHPLTKLPNCVLSPHKAYATEKTRELMLKVAVQNLLNGIEGKPLISSAY